MHFIKVTIKLISSVQKIIFHLKKTNTTKLPKIINIYDN